MRSKKSLIIASTFLLSISSTSFGYSTYFQNNTGYYCGGQLGLADVHERESDLYFSNSSIADKGLAGRIFFGVDLSPNIGFEIGIARYSDVTIEDRYSKMQFSQLSVDVLAKFSAPVDRDLSFYAKAGVAGVSQYNFKFGSRNGLESLEGCDSYSRPLVGVGLAYSINPRAKCDIGAYHIFGEGYLEDINFLGAGVAFRIG
ncbi:MAG: outer membrane beta-barrel protein [Gammaproteobacteria bacterium]|nr:outer membrane beta-barrel protein [Gammaproteobacteria bacterium]